MYIQLILDILALTFLTRLVKEEAACVWLAMEKVPKGKGSQLGKDESNKERKMSSCLE